MKRGVGQKIVMNEKFGQQVKPSYNTARGAKNEKTKIHSKDPRISVHIEVKTSIQATVYKMEKLRCNL